MESMLKEPLAPAAAKALLVACLGSGGVVRFSPHARKEMVDDGISEAEALSVLRGGVVEPGEKVSGSFRYRVRAAKVYVVVTFRSATTTVVVTAWRKKR